MAVGRGIQIAKDAIKVRNSPRQVNFQRKTIRNELLYYLSMITGK